METEHFNGVLLRFNGENALSGESGQAGRARSNHGCTSALCRAKRPVREADVMCLEMRRGENKGPTEH
jgi:hypothetical protein